LHLKLKTLIIITAISTQLSAGWSTLSNPVSTGASQISSQSTSVMTSLATKLTTLGTTTAIPLMNTNKIKKDKLEMILTLKKENTVLFSSIENSQKKATQLSALE
jgi:hypothetical protein